MNTLIRRKIIRKALEWPEPPVPFPAREFAFRANIEWPLLMAPWRGGFQSMYEPATGLFHWPDAPPLWNYYQPQTEHILMGETFREDMRAPEYMVKFLLNQFGGGNFPLESNLFQVNDTGETDRTAIQRSNHVVNLGPQPPEVKVPQLYQANDPESFNKFLANFKSQGCIGAIARPLESGCSDAQFIIIDPF